MKDDQLIFIISQPRAGSTFLQKIISNNEKVATTSEPWLLLSFSNFFRDDLIQARYNEKVALTAVSDFLQKTCQQALFTDKLKEVMLSLYKGVIGEKEYFLDKTPRYYEVLPQLIEWFPNSRIIVLKRNPFAVLHSMIKTWGNGRIDLENLLSYERDFLEAPFLIQKFLDAYGSLENVMEVKYEDIVKSPEAHIERIYTWLGISYSDKVLNFKENDQIKGIFGDDVYKVKRDESYSDMPNSKSLHNWEFRVIEKQHRRFFTGYEKELGEEFLAHYGYSGLPASIKQKEYRIFEKLLFLKANPALANIDIKKYIKYKFL